MPDKIAIVDFHKCRPEKCEGGIRLASLACPHKLIQQEEPYEIPMFHPSTCQGCSDCVKACPLKAIRIVRT
jgi:translation initiation factor RLI1